MARRVMLHVGTPKTGTSYVQDVLLANQDSLAEQGILYPADRHDAHFLAALDLMQLPWGGLEEQAVGRWDQLAEQVRRWDGTAIISHEILGTASRGQVRRALTSLGTAEIHIVLSARDLARQLPAEWQENVKHRRTLTYTAFLDQICDENRTGQIAQWFWGVQEIPEILDRWAGTIPADRVHLITVPPPGGPREELWNRFADTLGVDRDLRPNVERSNVSLGVPEVAMLRRLNELLNDRLPNHYFRELVREGLVHRFLAQGSSSARLSLPPQIHEWTVSLSRAWVTALGAQGYDVVGSLEDLVPQPATGTFTDPDQPDEAEVAGVAVRSLAHVLQETVRMTDELAQVHRDNADLMRQIDELHATASYRAKERLVALAASNYPARVGLAAYRRLRERNSRSA
ncbi:MAG TPA: hypothetical protein PKM12_03240 [Marmoricola sp.]|nr:hypothetical protein [Marmoricola sp.]HNI70176.1 hypothetical protein [Marmoricola sp.]HNN47956.1 hypothetical protein [Marmoricola sp.]